MLIFKILKACELRTNIHYIYDVFELHYLNHRLETITVVNDSHRVSSMWEFFEEK